MKPTRGRRLDKMRTNILSIACCMLLLIEGNAGDSEAFACDENVPKTIQKPLLDAINKMRVKPFVSDVEYETNCNLGKEAFTGVSGGTSFHRGFEMESKFDGTWKETLDEIVQEKQNQVNDPGFKEVGCGIRLHTSDDGAHNLNLTCVFREKNKDPR